MKNPLYSRFLGKAFSVAAAATVVFSPVSIAQGTPAGGSSSDIDFTGGVRHNLIPADQLLSQGKYADAEDMYRQSLINNPNDMLATVGLGMALAKQFKLDGADDMFDRVLLQDPNNATAHAGKATVALNRLQSSSGTIRGQKESILKYAEDEARRATSLAPANAEAHYALGCVLREQGQNDAAASEFKNACSLDPRHSYAFSALGKIQLDQGSSAQAAENFRRAIELNSGNSTAHYGLGVALFQQGMTDEAIKELNTSLYQFPNSAPVRMALGDAYDKQGNTAAAIKEYQTAISIKPEIADPYLKLAGIRESRGDLELALADLRSGLAQMPYNVDLRMRIADELLKLEKCDDAIKAYKTILSMRANDPQAVKGLTAALCIKAQKAAAGALLASNDYDSAIHTLNDAIKLNPNDMELRLAQAKLMSMAGAKPDMSQIPQPTNDGERMPYASALMAQGNFEQATAMVSDVVSRLSDPKQSFAVADLALMMDDLDNAEAAYKKAQAQGGVAARADRGLADVAKYRQRALEDVRVADELIKKKQFDGATERYRDAIATNPKLPEAHLGLAKTLEKLPKVNSVMLREAVTQYQHYLSLQPSMSDKDKAKFLENMDKLKTKADKLALKEPKAPIAVGSGSR
jgi:tetratricopeptide (TPR) repeat protein